MSALRDPVEITVAGCPLASTSRTARFRFSPAASLEGPGAPLGFLHATHAGTSDPRCGNCSGGALERPHAVDPPPLSTGTCSAHGLAALKGAMGYEVVVYLLHLLLCTIQ